MKKKSLQEEQRNSLNESSSILEEPSFSKITFRKRDHDDNPKMLSIISEEKDELSNELDSGPTNELNPIIASNNDSGYPEGKKKRKKKKVSSEERCMQVHSDEVNSIPAFQAECNQNYSSQNLPTDTDYKRKKKKKTVPQNPSRELSEEHVTDKNEDENPIDLGVEFEPNYSAVSTDDTYVPKKKKKKPLVEDTKYELNNDEESIKDLDLVKFEGGKVLTSKFSPKETSKRNPKSKTNKSVRDTFVHNLEDKNVSLPVENASINNKFENFDSTNDDLEKIDYEDGSGVDTCLNSPRKKHKRKPSQYKDSSVETDDNLDSPSSKNKVKRLKSEIDMSLSYSEYIEEYRSSEEKKEAENYNDTCQLDSQDTTTFHVNSPKKKKKKKKNIHKLMDEPNLNLSGYEPNEADGKGTEIKEVGDSKDMTQSVSRDTTPFNLTPPKKKKKKDKKLLVESNFNLLENGLNQDDGSFKDIIEVKDTTQSVSQETTCINVTPLQKKKKDKKLLGENHFNLSGNKPDHSYRINREINEVKDNKDVTQSVSQETNSTPPKKKKKKDKKLLDKNNLNNGQQIKNHANNTGDNKVEANASNAEGSSIINTINDVKKSKMLLAEKISSLLALDSPIINLEDKEQLDKKNQLDKHKFNNDSPKSNLIVNDSDIESSQEKDKLKLKSPPPNSPNSKQIKLIKKNKNKQLNKNNLEELSTKCATTVKYPNSKNSVIAADSCSESKPTIVESSPKEKVKKPNQDKKSPKNNNKTEISIESMRNKLLKKVLSGLEEDDSSCKFIKTKPLVGENVVKPPKPSKLKIAVHGNDDILRKPFEETISSKTKSGNVPPKSRYPITADEVNVDSLRKRLLQEALGGTNVPHKSKNKVQTNNMPESAPLKSSKIKAAVEENVDSLRKRLLEEAIGGKKKLLKSLKQKTGVQQNYLLQEPTGHSTDAKKLQARPDKVKGGFKTNTDKLRKQLLEEAIGGKKQSENTPLKSSKQKKAVKGNVEFLRKHLLEEAVGRFKEAKDLPSKSTTKSNKAKAGVKTNANNLRNNLLNGANSGTKKTEALSLDIVQQKLGIEEQVGSSSSNKVVKSKIDSNTDVKGKIKKQHKKKHKTQNNYIDVLTNVMVSTALQKVSNCSTSHSS